MPLSYFFIDTEDAFNQGLIDYKPYRPGSACFRSEDGKLTILGLDTGEIEDKSFLRDFSWIIRELNYAKDYHKKEKLQEIQLPANEIQANIRSRSTEYLARRNGATTPEARAIYKAKLLDLRAECTHPSLNKTNTNKACLDCGANIP